MTEAAAVNASRAIATTMSDRRSPPSKRPFPGDSGSSAQEQQQLNLASLTAAAAVANAAAVAAATRMQQQQQGTDSAASDRKGSVAAHVVISGQH